MIQIQDATIFSKSQANFKEIPDIFYSNGVGMEVLKFLANHRVPKNFAPTPYNPKEEIGSNSHLENVRGSTSHLKHNATYRSLY